MLIQCQSCNTKYRLNLERIPKRKTFVRCKSCGTPIYIDPTEEEPPVEGVLPPQSGQQQLGQEPLPAEEGQAEARGAAEDGLQRIICPSCEARYRLPTASLNRPGLKLKCTQCEHVFDVRQAVPDMAGLSSTVGGGASKMPLPNEQHVETMFDDLRSHQTAPDDSGPRHLRTPPEDIGDAGPQEFDAPDGPPDPDLAYEDAVAFEASDGLERAKRQSGVPDDQRYRLFLNPDEYARSDTDMADDLKEEPSGAPLGDQGRAGTGDLPPLDSHALPPLGGAQTASHAGRGGLRALVHAAKPLREPWEYEKFLHREDDQPPPRNLAKERRQMSVLIAAAAAVIVLAGAWGYWLATAPGRGDAFVLQAGAAHQLLLSGKLQGRYVTNGPSGKKLFVVNGELGNQFDPGSQLRWVRIRGVAYEDTGETKPLGSAFAYAGNLLDDKQLGTWDLAAVRAYYGYNNGREDLNYDIPTGATVPYQLVFTDVGVNVQRTVAEVVSYNRNGQSVYVATQ